MLEGDRPVHFFDDLVRGADLVMNKFSNGCIGFLGEVELSDSSAGLDGYTASNVGDRSMILIQCHVRRLDFVLRPRFLHFVVVRVER